MWCVEWRLCVDELKHNKDVEVLQGVDGGEKTVLVKAAKWLNVAEGV